MSSSPFQITPFSSASDYERVLDYFLGADESFLRGMGVDPKKLPQRAAWLERLVPDLTRPDDRVLVKTGFHFVKRYRTIPGLINSEQDVNRYVIENG